jgi:hypothetical protein
MHPSATQRSRLRALNQLHPTSEPRILNYFCFPNIADELHETLEAGCSFDDSDSDQDSDYELPPQTVHREGNQLPAFRIKWYKEGEQCAAQELARLPLQPAATDQEDWYGIMVLPKPESEPEPVEEEDERLDSPSRQLREELSQFSQSQLQSQKEAARVDVYDDDPVEDAQPVVTPVHDEVMLWVTQDSTSTPTAAFKVSESWLRDGELELERKRKRTAHEKLLRRLNGEREPC